MLIFFSTSVNFLTHLSRKIFSVNQALGARRWIEEYHYPILFWFPIYSLLQIPIYIYSLLKQPVNVKHPFRLVHSCGANNS